MKELKLLRKRVNITQSQLASRLGVRQSAVAMWENGINMPRASKLPQLAKILNCSVNELFK